MGDSPPWNPPPLAELSPEEFERLVLAWLRAAAEKDRLAATFAHLGLAHGDGGDYRIDVLAEFQALGGAVFVVLVECKCHKRPVEREDVQTLESKLTDTRAQKAMIFSTSGFQLGAIAFADAKHIATVSVTEGRFTYHTRALSDTPTVVPPCVRIDPYVGIRVCKTAEGVACQVVDTKSTRALEEWIAAERPV